AVFQHWIECDGAHMEVKSSVAVISFGNAHIPHSTLQRVCGLLRRVFEPLITTSNRPMTAEQLTKAKSLGFSDRQIAHLTGKTEDAVRAERKKLGLAPSYRLVDTCAAEFEAYTPYYYSTYDRGDDEVRASEKKKVMILGGGPNRIGQGIEFD